jgi:hypothetical protein
MDISLGATYAAKIIGGNGLEQVLFLRNTYNVPRSKNVIGCISVNGIENIY